MLRVDIAELRSGSSTPYGALSTVKQLWHGVFACEPYCTSSARPSQSQTAPHHILSSSDSLHLPILSPSMLRTMTPTVKKGDRVAQLVLEVIKTPEVEEVEELDDTERGANGYGSTGVDKSLAAAAAN